MSVLSAPTDQNWRPSKRAFDKASFAGDDDRSFTNLAAIQPFNFGNWVVAHI